MLHFLRDASTGWLAKILIGLLVISFAVWGVSGSLFYGNSTTVAQVGETEVSTVDFRLAYENQLGALSQRFGRRLSRQQADLLGLRNNVVNQVVAGAVLDENARKMGLGIGQEDLAEVIASDPAFRDLSGNFSRNALEVTLRQNRISEEDYINSRKRLALRNQIQAGTAASLDMPAAFNDAYAQYLNEKRIFEYVEFGPEVVEETPKPEDGDLNAFYEENKDNYVAPEYRKLQLIDLQASRLSNPGEITEEEIQAEYERRKDRLRSPERRTIEQLVLDNAEQAEEVSQKLQSGVAFETVVEELGKNLTDISLGTVTAEDLPDETVSAAAFEAEANSPTEVVQGIFGPVILRVTEIMPERTTPYADIKDELRNDLALSSAGDRVFELFDVIEEERGAGEGVMPIAAKLDLESRVIEAIDANGLDMKGNPVADVPAIQQLLRGAFDSQPGDDTRPVEIGADGFVWFDVAEIIPERQKPFEEVRTEVEQAWVAAETVKRMQAVAEKIGTEVKSGKTFDEAVAEVLPADSFGQPVKPSRSEALARSAQNAVLAPPVLAAGFRTGKDTVAHAQSSPEAIAVFKVVEIEMPEDNSLEENVESGINEIASQDVLSQLVVDLQSRETVTINEAAIEAAFNPNSGGHSGF